MFLKNCIIICRITSLCAAVMICATLVNTQTLVSEDYLWRAIQIHSSSSSS